ELLWKTIVAALLGMVMLLTHIPSYFQNLYSYTYGAYFANELWTARVDFLTLLKASMMATALNYDVRVPVFVAISIATLCFCALRCTGALKRIAIAVLFSEASIVTLGAINAVSFRYPIGLFYSEVLHEAFLAAFFVLFLMLVITVLGFTIDTVFIRSYAHHKNDGILEWLIEHRGKLLVSSLFLAAVSQAVAMPSATSFHPYPAKRPPSVEILRN